MNEYTRKIIKVAIAGILFVLFMGLVIVGQKTVGLPHLGLMLLGLSGLLLLLYLYNRGFTGPRGRK